MSALEDTQPMSLTDIQDAMRGRSTGHSTAMDVENTPELSDAALLVALP